MNIRPLSWGNAEDQSHFRKAIHALYVELFGASAAPSAQSFADLERTRSTSKVQHWALGAFLDESETELVGLATLAESFAAFAGGPYLILGELWIHHDFRSRGLGAQILQQCQELAVLHGYGRIDVAAPSDPRWNRTHAFYERNGFVPTGRKLKLLVAPKVKA